MSEFVAVVGTDGSGKTTLAERVAEILTASGVPAVRQWMGAESYVMAPIRWILGKARRRVSPGLAEDPDSYRGDVVAKAYLAGRYKWASSVYLFFVFLDYRLQYWAKIRSLDDRIIVADRYLYDVCVNAGMALGWTPQEVVSLVRRKLTQYRLPMLNIYVRVSGETSMARKSDIPDIRYVSERLRYYDHIAEALGFVILDGNQPVEVNASRIAELAENASRQTHVLYVHSNNTDVGGADRVLASMASHTARYSIGGLRPFRSTVLLRAETSIVDVHAANRTNVLLCRFIRPQTSMGIAGVARSAAGLVPSAWRIHRALSFVRPSIVHVNDLYDVLPAVIAKVHGLPVVHHLRMIKGKTVFRAVLARAITWDSCATVSVSHAVRRHYFGEPGRADHNRVIRDLAAQSARSVARQHGSESDNRTRLVVMVGRVEPWKGQSVFVEAMRLLAEHGSPGLSSMIVGGGVAGRDGYYEHVARRAAEVGVTMAGERQDVLEILSRADVAVHCSIEPDPFPGVVLEAMLVGPIVVAARAGGVVEMIDDGVHGLLAQPGSAADLSETIRRALQMSETDRESMRRSSRQRALDLTDPQRVDEELAGLYRLVRSGGQEEG